MSAGESVYLLASLQELVQAPTSAKGLRGQPRAVQQLFVKSFDFSGSFLHVPGTKHQQAVRRFHNSHARVLAVPL